MNIGDKYLEDIVAARKIAATCLLKVLSEGIYGCSEQEIEERWVKYVSECDSVEPKGWYVPPPNGVAVLIGQEPIYSRLEYQSLREEKNWPTAKFIYDNESILYPYYSIVNKESGMIGDFVGTFYAGKNSAIREWIALVLDASKNIIEQIEVGMSFEELYFQADHILKGIGAKNNTFSITQDLQGDMGHTVPYFSEFVNQGVRRSCEMSEIAAGRKFIKVGNKDKIGKNEAFTIEPQAICDGLPMVSFHFIVVLNRSRLTVVAEFDEIFEFFGMNDWLSS